MFDEVLTTNQQVVWALGVASLRSAADRDADLAALDFCIEDLVVESLSRAGLEEDPRAALLDDLVILRRDRGDRNLERALRQRLGRHHPAAVIIADEIAAQGLDFEQLEPMVGAAGAELEGTGVAERPGGGPRRRGLLERFPHRRRPRAGHDADRRPRRPHPSRPTARTRRRAPYDFMRRVLATDTAASYSRWQWMVEPAFAQIKTNRRVERFRRRGRAAPRSECRLITATHNLVKLWRHQIAPTTPHPSRRSRSNCRAP